MNNKTQQRKICGDCLHYEACSGWNPYSIKNDNASRCPNYQEPKVRIETRIFDKEEIFENCTVQVLTNTVTGEVSVGWRRNE